VMDLRGGYPTPFAWHPSSRLFATGTQRGQVTIFDRSVREQKLLDVGGREIVSIEWQPSGDLFLATSMSGRICIWDARNYNLVYQRGVASECIAKWSHDGTKVALSSSIGEIFVLKVADWTTHFVVEADPRNDFLERSPIAWWMDDTELYFAHHGGDPKVRAWSIRKRAVIRELDIEEVRGLSDLHALIDGAVVLRADDTLRYMLGQSAKHLPVVSENAFSHDVDGQGRFVAGVGNDVWVFGAKHKHIARAYCGPKGGASVALTHDGKRLAVGCDDGGIRVYTITA
jgi:WD40 repeat protein